MARRVLIITGSPRKNGNTNALAMAFKMGAEAAGNTVEVLDAASTGAQDDVNKLGEMMCRADTLVLVSPLYWKSFTSQIKRVIDRFYQFTSPEERKKCTIKNSVLIAVGADTKTDAFNAMEIEFDHINATLGFKEKGKLLVGGLVEAEDAMKDVSLITRAATMGYQISEDADFSASASSNSEAGMPREMTEKTWLLAVNHRQQWI